MTLMWLTLQTFSAFTNQNKKKHTKSLQWMEALFILEFKKQISLETCGLWSFSEINQSYIKFYRLFQITFAWPLICLWPKIFSEYSQVNIVKCIQSCIKMYYCLALGQVVWHTLILENHKTNRFQRDIIVFFVFSYSKQFWYCLGLLLNA